MKKQSSLNAAFSILTFAAGLLAIAISASATTYELRENTPLVFGKVWQIKTRFEDTLPDLARLYGLGYEEIIRANPGVDIWLPGKDRDVTLPGRRILPPAPHEGIVVNLPEHRLYYFPKARKGEIPVVITYPVSIGKMDWHTPLGETRIMSKERNPAWYPPESVRKEHLARGDPLPPVIRSGPENPLGEYAMRLAIKPGTYMIHGTNNPIAVGMAVTHGCIRMYPEDIYALFPIVPIGTKVWLINQPVKVAYVDGELLLEVHPQLDSQGQVMEPDLSMLSGYLDKALGENTAAINWDLAIQTLKQAKGIPTVVGLEADASAWKGAAAPAPAASAAVAPVPPSGAK